MTTEKIKVSTTNRSKTYLVPLLNTEVELSDFDLMLNSFIKFNPPVDIAYPLGVLYETVENDNFRFYRNVLRINPLFHSEYDFGKQLLFIFNFPSAYQKDYIAFKEGKYSKMSDSAKRTILTFSAEIYKYPPLIEDITGILWKHAVRRQKLEKELNIKLPDNSELASKINIEDETFNINEYEFREY